MQRVGIEFGKLEEITSRMYRNAEMLLDLYKKIRFRVKSNLSEVDSELYIEDRKHLTNLLQDIIDFDVSVEKRKIEDRLISNDLDLCLLEVMEDALLVLKEYPDNGELYYRLLRYRYFDSGRNTNELVMERLDDMPSTTYYRKRKEAIELYASMLWAFTRSKKDYRHLHGRRGKNMEA